MATAGSLRQAPITHRTPLDKQSMLTETFIKKSHDPGFESILEPTLSSYPE